MKKIILPALLVLCFGCRNANNENASADSGKRMLKADTTVNPNGITNDAVISTDTAAYKLHDSSAKKGVGQ